MGIMRSKMRSSSSIRLGCLMLLSVSGLTPAAEPRALAESTSSPLLPVMAAKLGCQQTSELVESVCRQHGPDSASCKEISALGQRTCMERGARSLGEAGVNTDTTTKEI